MEAQTNSAGLKKSYNILKDKYILSLKIYYINIIYSNFRFLKLSRIGVWCSRDLFIFSIITFALKDDCKKTQENSYILKLGHSFMFQVPSHLGHEYDVPVKSPHTCCKPILAKFIYKFQTGG